MNPTRYPAVVCTLIYVFKCVIYKISAELDGCFRFSHYNVVIPTGSTGTVIQQFHILPSYSFKQEPTSAECVAALITEGITWDSC